MDEIDALLTKVRTRTGGLMPLVVYRRLYETAAALGGGTIVEIGTYRGGATLALALGARANGAPFRIVTADVLHDRVGLPGRSVEEKKAAFADTLAAFSCAGAAELVAGDSAQLVAEADPRDIRLLLLDGGGRLETDLALLWDRLADDAVIVIDDIDGSVTARRRRGAIEVEQKHRISMLLVERFVGAGLLIEETRIVITGWFRRGPARIDAAEILVLGLPAYHALIRAEVPAREYGLIRSGARWAADRAPWLRRVLGR
jgi:predicted O-methyltransferase YrrM